MARAMLPRALGAVLLLSLAAFAWRQIRRRPEADMPLALKRHSQRNRAYRFSLPPIERPK